MHRLIVSIVTRWNQNIFFKYISSVKLAVPVMVVLILSISIGTVLESRHNAEYAKIALYDASWFQALLALLGINVFSSMLSRYPWKIRHTGFVMTHIGILTLLVGSWVTKVYGIDGSLQIQEGQTQNIVVLPRLMVGYQFEGSPSLNSVVFSKTLFEKAHSELSFLNDKIGHILTVKQFVPFAEIERAYQSSGEESGPVGLSFGLKSAFFDVKDWLHSEDNPEFQMGPATLRLILDSTPTTQIEKSRRQLHKELQKEQHKEQQKERQIAKAENDSATMSIEAIVVSDEKTKKPIKKLTIAELKKGVKMGEVNIQLIKIYQRAVVADNSIVESEDPTSPPNRAAELLVEKSGQKIREVLYAKFPGFSLNQDGVFGLSFRLEGTPGAESAQPMADLPPGHPPLNESTSEERGAPAILPGKNVIEFHVNRNQKDQVRVVLLKEGKKIAEKMMKEGDIFQTPWMGMQLFLGTISFGSESQILVKSIKPPPGKNLPPSAIQIQPVGTNSPIWLAQGDVKKINLSGRPAFVVFSNESLNLPFELRLDEFSKKDYPGTETPYSYESLVTNLKDNQQTLISMNEPLKVEGYTLYQASFSMTPGQKPVSVLSVNKDPGRAIKYLGSLILSLGIVTFTLMRSRFYKEKLAGKVNL